MFNKIEANLLFITARVISHLGVDMRDNKKIDLLFGTHDIQTWNTKLDITNDKLDLSEFTKVFIEY